MSNEIARTKFLEKISRKLAFSKFVNDKKCMHMPNSASSTEVQHNPHSWTCCGSTFSCPKKIHQHVALSHNDEITRATEVILSEGSEDARWAALMKKAPLEQEEQCEEMMLPCEFYDTERNSWLPEEMKPDEELHGDGQVLLFYKYRNIKNVEHVRAWQEALCRRLHLTGKVRIASEGINATVAGSVDATKVYMDCVRHHPLFNEMTEWDFKKSPGSHDIFPNGLKIGVYQEIVPMGISPDLLSHTNTGKHMSAEEFHGVMTRYLEQDDVRKKTLLIDCRNFYESKIGQFQGALCPDIRKFSYWPEFVSKNRKLFENKDIYMYCTGGIRCERGSAYLLEQGIGDNVYQLHGGIHKYIEKYPDGYFRGKLFVFDDRFHIQANEDIVSACCYCKDPWDQYQPCSSSHCHQLVLSCPKCRAQGLTSCCHSCQRQSADNTSAQEQCDCTKSRPRIPVEKLPD